MLLVMQHNCVWCVCVCMHVYVQTDGSKQPSEQQSPVSLTLRHRLIVTLAKQQRRLILL